MTVDHTERPAAEVDQPAEPGAQRTGRSAAPGPPAGPLTAEDRRAAFAAGTPRMSRRVIAAGIAVLLVLGVGGAVADHFVTSSAPAPAASDRSPTGQHGPAVPNHAGTSTKGAQLGAPLSAYLGIDSLKDAPAPGFTLTDAATNAPVTLADLAGHVVVLTFANAPCNDICPVLAQELAQADALMGATTVPVTFVTVNTDPLAVAPADAAMLTRTPLGGLHNYRFLTGRIKTLNPVWVSYGISITANRATRAVTHNELLYFITPSGKIAWSATPFANESPSGTYSLPAAEVARFAAGIAHYARKLAETS